MNYSTIVILGILGWLVCGLIGAALAKEKGREQEGLILGFLFGPIGIVIALLLPARTTGRRNAGTTFCPYCATAIRVSDVECPSCHRAQPLRRSKAEWERTVAGADDVEKWATKQEKGDVS